MQQVTHQEHPYRPDPELAPPFTLRRTKPKPQAFRTIELGAALAMAVIVDVASWHDGVAGGGFGLAAFFVLVPLTMLVATRTRTISARLIVVGAAVVALAVRSAYAPTPCTIVAGMALIGAFALALRRRHLSVPDAILSAVASGGMVFTRVDAAMRGVVRIGARSRLGKVNVLPIAVPAGLFVAFIGVFALANPVVAHGVTAAWHALTGWVVLPSIGRVAIWGITIVAATALLRPAIWAAKGTNAATVDGEATSTALLVARNALVGLNVLFLGYNALDARYLWSGAAPAGMSTQDYAHQGAFWLTIALNMLTAVIGVMFTGPLAHDVRAAGARTLAYVWMAQGLVLGLGTYRRIAIHIAHSGLSDLRIVGILGTTLVLFGVVSIALKLRDARSFTWLLRRQLDAFAVTAVVYLVTPTHLLGAEVNVARIEQGEYRPLLHTFAQSKHAESAASLLPLLHHRDARVRQGVGALLLEERATLRDQAIDQTSWKSRDISSRRALAQLEAAKIDAAVGDVPPALAKDVLLQISRVANEDRSLEEILAIPAATYVQ